MKVRRTRNENGMIVGISRVRNAVAFMCKKKDSRPRVRLLEMKLNEAMSQSMLLIRCVATGQLSVVLRLSKARQLTA
jgi:hypothetical protein